MNPSAPPDLLRAALPTAGTAPAGPDLARALQRPFIADHVVQALAVGRAQPHAAAAAMAAWFRRTRRLGSRDRRVVAQGAHGVIRHEALLRRVVGSPESQATCTRCADVELVAALARLLAGDRFEQLQTQGPVADLATALSLPAAIAAEWLSVLGPHQAAELAATLAGRAPVYLRVNVAWGARQAALDLLAQDKIAASLGPGPWALRLDQRANLQATRAFRHGAVEVQDLSSQAFVAAIAVAVSVSVSVSASAAINQPNTLDLCAGAGGKTLALAALGARVTAWDVRRGALDQLRRRAARASLPVEIAAPSGTYDLVVVDAPCSGSGRLMREPALRWGLDPTRHLATQTDLLLRGSQAVCPGGVLAYATCSLLAAEQDPPTPPGFSMIEDVVRWPHHDPGDGFSWRLWRREG